jgi:hypothetical protein
MSTKNPAGNIIDVAAKVSDLDAYYFLGVSGAVTMTGFFVDANGHRARKADGSLSVAFSGSIPQGSGGSDGVTFASIAGLSGSLAANCPNAVGWIGTLSGAVYMDIQDSGTPSGDFKSNASRYPQLSSSNLKTLARVA